MKKKKPSNGLTPWKARQRAIQSADSLLAKADALLAAEARNPKQAALFYEAAARAYLRGTLGLMSRKPWASAKECYQRLGDELNVAKCDRLRAAIPAYWEDDDQSPPETALMSD
ncbi:MAG: hypothetical protein JW395_1630 [Nitrospira sp.]|nr:hypothetical protein [Nitrospira sp.]